VQNKFPPPVPEIFSRRRMSENLFEKKASMVKEVVEEKVENLNFDQDFKISFGNEEPKKRKQTFCKPPIHSAIPSPRKSTNLNSKKPPINFKIQSPSLLQVPQRIGTKTANIVAEANLARRHSQENQNTPSKPPLRFNSLPK